VERMVSAREARPNKFRSGGAPIRDYDPPLTISREYGGLKTYLVYRSADHFSLWFTSEPNLALFKRNGEFEVCGDRELLDRQIVMFMMFVDE